MRTFFSCELERIEFVIWILPVTHSSTATSRNLAFNSLNPFPFCVATMPQYKLHYFGIRGRGEILRLMFNAAGVPFEDHRIEMKDWPTLKSSVYPNCSIRSTANLTVNLTRTYTWTKHSSAVHRVPVRAVAGARGGRQVHPAVVRHRAASRRCVWYECSTLHANARLLYSLVQQPLSHLSIGLAGKSAIEKTQCITISETLKDLVGGKIRYFYITF